MLPLMLSVVVAGLGPFSPGEVVLSPVVDGQAPLRVSVTSVQREGGARCTTRELRRVTDGATLELVRGCGLREQWTELRPGVFEHELFLDAAPAGDGDLVVRLAIPSPWRQRDADGDVFAGPGAPAWRYGAAFVVGSREPHRLVTRRTADGLELVVPRALLAPGAFPLHIDPLVSTPLAPFENPRSLGRTTVDNLNDETDPVVAWTSTGSTALALFSDDRALLGTDLHAKSWTAGGAPQADLLFPYPGRQEHPAMTVTSRGRVFFGFAGGGVVAITSSDETAPVGNGLLELLTDGGAPSLAYDPSRGDAGVFAAWGDGKRVCWHLFAPNEGYACSPLLGDRVIGTVSAAAGGHTAVGVELNNGVALLINGQVQPGSTTANGERSPAVTFAGDGGELWFGYVRPDPTNGAIAVLDRRDLNGQLAELTLEVPGRHELVALSEAGGEPVALLKGATDLELLFPHTSPTALRALGLRNPGTVTALSLATHDTAGFFAFAHTRGSSAQRVDVGFLELSDATAPGVTPIDPLPEFAAQSSARVASNGSVALAVWRSGHKTLRGQWLNRVGTGPASAPFDLYQGIGTIDGFDVALNGPVAMVVLSAGPQFTALTFDAYASSPRNTLNQPLSARLRRVHVTPFGDAFAALASVGPSTLIATGGLLFARLLPVSGAFMPTSFALASGPVLEDLDCGTTPGVATANLCLALVEVETATGAELRLVPLDGQTPTVIPVSELTPLALSHDDESFYGYAVASNGVSPEVRQRIFTPGDPNPAERAVSLPLPMDSVVVGLEATGPFLSVTGVTAAGVQSAVVIPGTPALANVSPLLATGLAADGPRRSGVVVGEIFDGDAGVSTAWWSSFEVPPEPDAGVDGGTERDSGITPVDGGSSTITLDQCGCTTFSPLPAFFAVALVLLWGRRRPRANSLSPMGRGLG
ncbi:MAG: hypothetical protein U0228_08300 [Myxococcaceae bacterium]